MTGPGRSNYFTITAIRAYIIPQAGSPAYNSPYVFAWSNYPGTTTLDRDPGTHRGHYWTVPGNASANSLQWIAYNTTNQHNFAAECVTACAARAEDRPVHHLSGERLNETARSPSTT